MENRNLLIVQIKTYLATLDDFCMELERPWRERTSFLRYRRFCRMHRFLISTEGLRWRMVVVVLAHPVDRKECSSS
jgi:hypothetical protein